MEPEELPYQIEVRGIGGRTAQAYGAFSRMFIIQWPGADRDMIDVIGGSSGEGIRRITPVEESGAESGPTENPTDFRLLSNLLVWSESHGEITEFFDHLATGQVDEGTGTFEGLADMAFSRNTPLNGALISLPWYADYIVIDEIVLRTGHQRRLSITDSSLLPTISASGYTRFSLDTSGFPTVDDCTLTIYYHLDESFWELLPDGVEYTPVSIHRSVSSNRFSIHN